MVRKAAVLLRVQHLQQRAGRVAVVGRGQLIHLVEHHNRVRDAAFVDAVKDAAGHRADIGAPVASDVRLIPHAAEADAHILPLQRPGDALADAGLPRAGRAHEQQDGAGLLSLQLHHRDLFQDALFDLFQPEMVRVKDLFRIVQGDGFRLLLFPGQGAEIFQVIRQHPGLVPVLPLGLEAVEKLPRLLLRGLVHAAACNLLFQLLDVRKLLGVHPVQLLLEIFDLLAQRLLLVELLVVLLLGGLGLDFYLCQLNVLIDHCL